MRANLLVNDLKMADSSNSLLPPNAGDYQRMGLRAEEFRPTVIRRAVEQSAQPLALMHLRSPSKELERTLLDVLVSAYRVLDPRRRNDPQSRVMLGRLHPQLADEAVQVAQARLAAPQRPTLSAVIPPPVEKVEGWRTTDGGRWTVDVQGTPIAERSTTLGTEDGGRREEDGATLERFIDTALVPGWEETLSAPDLLVQLPTTRAYRAARRQLVNAPFATVIAIAVLAGSLLLIGSWWMLANRQSLADQQQVAVSAKPVGPTKIATSATNTTTANQARVETPTGTEQAKAWTPTGPGQAEAGTQAGAEQAEAGIPTLPELPGLSVINGWATVDELAVPILPDFDETPTLLTASSRRQVPADDLAALDQVILEQLLQDEDETQELLTELETLTVPEAAANQESEQNIAVVRPAVPPQAEQAAARLHVETLVRSYHSSATNADPAETQLIAAEPALGLGLVNGLSGAERQIVLLRAIASDSPTGSAQRWVATVLAGQAALLADREDDTRQAIAELTQSFAVDRDEATVELARWAAGDVVNHSQRQRLGQWLDEQVRRHVLDGELASASELVSIAYEFGMKHRDEPIKSQSKLWRDSLAIANRYAEAAERLDSLAADQASAEERGMVGRYWALVRRDWHRALPHLAAGSNAKLAHFAGIELLAGVIPDAQDATLLADGYVNEAKRAKGWLADSYILHAHELLVAAAEAAGEAEGLELAQAAEKLREEQPAAFVGMAPATTPESPERMPTKVRVGLVEGLGAGS